MSLSGVYISLSLGLFAKFILSLVEILLLGKVFLIFY
jgi:hypothetical protein